VYDSYESDSELDMQDFQEHTAKSYPLFTKEKNYEEISHLGPIEDTEKQIEEHSLPTIPVYEDYESNPWESHEEEKEQKKGQSISYPELTSEWPSPEINQPASSFHSPVLTRDIQPGVSNCKAKKAFCCQLHGFFHSFYEPIREYMELHFLHILNPPRFIQISALGGRIKDVIIQLS
jgi:hypothetical protein